VPTRPWCWFDRRGRGFGHNLGTILDPPGYPLWRGAVEQGQGSEGPSNRRYAIVSPRDLTEGVAKLAILREGAGGSGRKAFGHNLGHNHTQRSLRLPRGDRPKIFRHLYFSRTLGGVAQLVEQGTFNP
jgi:hypothetical protein